MGEACLASAPPNVWDGGQLKFDSGTQDNSAIGINVTANPGTVAVFFSGASTMNNRVSGTLTVSGSPLPKQLRTQTATGVTNYFDKGSSCANPSPTVQIDAGIIAFTANNFQTPCP